MPSADWFRPVAQYDGVHSQPVSMTERLPWLYVIAAMRERLLYVGETHDEGGLVVRLGRHFGPYATSTFRQRCIQVAGVMNPKGPFLVVAARMPSGDEAPIDCTSKQLRLLCETYVHSRVATRFIAARPGWVVVSSSTATKIGQNPVAEQLSDALVDSFEHLYFVNEEICRQTLFHLVILDAPAPQAGGEEDIGAILEKAELLLCNWVIRTLRAEQGDNWWTQGVPEQTRKSCVVRREEEKAYETAPPEAYLMLIDLRDIIRQNWALFSKVAEKVAGAQGKDKGTDWLVTLNEVRKRWAHPLKRQFMPMPGESTTQVRAIYQKLELCTQQTT